MSEEAILRTTGIPRVLVVDDERGITRISGAHLKQVGYDVIMSDSAEEALQRIETERIDVILTDYLMPFMNGIELLCKAREFQPDAVRILFTGQSDLHIAEEASLRADIFRFLAKPFTGENLKACVKDAISFRENNLKERLLKQEIENLVQIQKRELEASGTLLGGLMEVLSFGVLVFGTNNKLTVANRAVHRILGIEERSLLGKTEAEVGVPPTMSGGEHPIDWKTPDGKTINLLWEKNLLEDGRIAYSIVDVTKRTSLERMVFRGKREIEILFDSITDPIYLINRKRVVTRCNRAFAMLIGKSYNDIIGATCTSLMAHLEPGCDACALKKSFADLKPRQREWNDKTGRIFRTHIFPAIEGNKVLGAVIRLQEVTAEKYREKQLLQSEKMASIGQLAAGVAHEINNPVGFIISGLNRLEEYSDSLTAFRKKALVLRDSAPIEGSYEKTWEAYVGISKENDYDYLLSDLHDLVGECKDGAERIRKIVQDLKLFSHPDQGAPQAADVNACLESSLNIAWNEMKYKCELVKEYGNLPPLLCHPTQLNQVFVNLLVNAAQAIPERGTVSLKTWFDPDQKAVNVEICDTGVGIPKEMQPRIFDPFYTTKPIGKGTGLGLHLSLGIVKGHGGKIHLESEPGKGSCFTVTLPLKADA